MRPTNSPLIGGKMKTGSQRIGNMVQSDIRAMTLECSKVQGINLGQGICDMPTPELVKSGAIEAINERISTYSPATGLEPLRKKLSLKLERDNQIQADPEKNIVVTAGTSGGFSSTLMSLFDPGDEIILFEPYYGYHLNSALLAGVIPKFVPMNGPNFEIDFEKLKEAITPKTRGLMICTPSNPCGKMWTESEIRLVGELANKHDFLLISDEIYEYFRYDKRKHFSPASFKEFQDRTVSLMGFSKTFSITGWRLGYVVAPEELSRPIGLANDLFYVCAPTPLQHAVYKGLDTPQSYYQDQMDEFTKKRDQICSALTRGGFEPIVPQGAYYVLADTSRFKFSDSKEAAMAILKETGVASVPGRAFYNSVLGEKYVRFCYSVEDDILNRACEKLSQFGGKN